MCLGTCTCSICKVTTDNMKRVGEAAIVRPFQEDNNFRQFAQSTKTLDNQIDLHNLDGKTREIIRYYQKLQGQEEQDERASSQSYAKILAELHRKTISGANKQQ